MNRRTFLATALIALAAPRATLGSTPVATPTTAMRAFETTDPSPTDPERILARVDRLTDATPPFPANLDELVELGHFAYFGAIRGEYWVGELEPVPAPNDLPPSAMFVDFASSAGVVGFREEHTLGMVETRGLRWTLQATDGARDERIRLVTDLASLLSERHPDGTPTSANDALEHLLPASDDFPFAVKRSDAPKSA